MYGFSERFQTKDEDFWKKKRWTLSGASWAPVTFMAIAAYKCSKCPELPTYLYLIYYSVGENAVI